MACIETYFITESPEDKNLKLVALIDKQLYLTNDDKQQLHQLRKYRNSWVHVDRIDDELILEDEKRYENETEMMALIAVKMLLTVLFSNPII